MILVQIGATPLNGNKAYRILGLTSTATADEVKTAYRKLASVNHPDKGGDTAKFQEIQEAYDYINSGKSDEHKFGFGDFKSNGFYDHQHSYNRYSWDDDEFTSFFKKKREPETKTFSAVIDMVKAYHGGSIDSQYGEVKYPAGIRSGTKIRVADYVMIEFYVTPHPVFKRANDDLLLEYTISAIDAIIGTSIEFKHLDGKVYNVKVKPGTQNGEVIRMSKYGMKNPDWNGVGDLFLTAKIDIPTKVEQSVIEVLKKSSMYSPKINIDSGV